MTTVLLVSIGILLAGLSTLMVVFYGGGSLSKASDRAQAVILENAGMNVVSAAGLYRASAGTAPQSLDDLVDGPEGSFLRSPPALGRAASGPSSIARDGGDDLVLIGGVAKSVCDAVNADYANGPTPSTRGSLQRGCYYSGASGTFFSVL